MDRTILGAHDSDNLRRPNGSVDEFDRKFFSDIRRQQSRLVVITPALATYWLKKRNTQNRTIRDAKVEMFARIMSSGFWGITNQGIGFDWDGRLVDGQHRLKALEASGSSYSFYVVTGLDPDSRFRVDNGTTRTLTDVMSMFSDFSNPKVAAGAIGSIRRFAYSLSHRETTEEQLAASKKFDRGIRWICENLSKGCFERGPIVGAAVFSWYRSPEIIDQFYRDISTGVGLSSKTDPAYKYREHAIKTPGRNEDQRSELFHRFLAAAYHRINGNRRVDQLRSSDQSLAYFKSKFGK